MIKMKKISKVGVSFLRDRLAISVVERKRELLFLLSVYEWTNCVCHIALYI